MVMPSKSSIWIRISMSRSNLRSSFAVCELIALPNKALRPSVHTSNTFSSGAIKSNSEGSLSRRREKACVTNVRFPFRNGQFLPVIGRESKNCQINFIPFSSISRSFTFHSTSLPVRNVLMSTTGTLRDSLSSDGALSSSFSAKSSYWKYLWSFDNRQNLWLWREDVEMNRLRCLSDD